MTKKTTHFGYQKIPLEEKARKVADVFNSVANKYDVMNDIMSLGSHRLWKRFAICVADVKKNQRVLDIASGSGDLALKLLEKVGEKGQVILSDINQTMLDVARNRMIDKGYAFNVRFVQADAQSLPFSDNCFDRITIGFGLRNVTEKQKALASMFRVLKPAGKCVILEFSKPVISGLQTIYDAYSLKVIPKLGELIAGDEASYRYLVESIRVHPDQKTLKTMMETAGFEQCKYYNLSGGIVSVHCGFKY